MSSKYIYSDKYKILWPATGLDPRHACDGGLWHRSIEISTSDDRVNDTIEKAQHHYNICGPIDGLASYIPP
ncbi:hypothetical protein LguiA_001127 [Lonicera macranthoides]